MADSVSVSGRGRRNKPSIVRPRMQIVWPAPANWRTQVPRRAPSIFPVQDEPGEDPRRYPRMFPVFPSFRMSRGVAGAVEMWNRGSDFQERKLANNFCLRPCDCRSASVSLCRAAFIRFHVGLRPSGVPLVFLCFHFAACPDSARSAASLARGSIPSALRYSFSVSLAPFGFRFSVAMELASLTDSGVIPFARLAFKLNLFVGL